MLLVENKVIIFTECSKKKAIDRCKDKVGQKEVKKGLLFWWKSSNEVGELVQFLFNKLK